MKILGIESTCDETGVAIVEDGTKIIANVVSSSADLHQEFGGVVPEVAAREQLRLILPVLQKVGGRKIIKNVDAIAVAHGPGLVGSLLIGVEVAKTLATVWGKPLIGVNHLIGHIYSCWLQEDSNAPTFPLIALVVSGGHTDLVLIGGHEKYKWLGGTRDDAAGECFDKVARILGLNYPGGPEIERIAKSFDSKIISHKFTRPMINENNFDFSFSGLKTQVAHRVGEQKLTKNKISEIAYEFQDAIVDVLVSKTLRACEKFSVKSVIVCGGVSANIKLINRFNAKLRKRAFKFFYPKKNLAIDNGAMIAAAAFFNKRFVRPETLSVNPGLHF